MQIARDLLEGRKDKTPVWVKNPHGVVSCLPKYLAEKYLNTRIGWTITEPMKVPKEKQYPLTGDFTAQGYKNRLAIHENRLNKLEETTEKKSTLVNLDKLKTEAREAGIKQYWLKSEETLLKELRNK